MMKWKILSKILISSWLLLFFLPQNTYAGSGYFIDGFDFPLGPPNLEGYSLSGGLGFLDRWDYATDGIKEYHPGEDLNDNNSGKDYGNDNNDAGDPVYAVANGRVIYADFAKESWGYVVLIEHTSINNEKYWSQYAHLRTISSGIFKNSVDIKRGAEIGRIGDFKYGSGKNYHLHFEIRKKYRGATDFVMNWPKEKVEEYYVNPTDFINSHRPPKPSNLNVVLSGANNIKFAWDKIDDPNLSKYELYSSPDPGGSQDQAKRTLLYSTENKDEITHELSNQKPGTYYFSLNVVYKNGLSATSAEKSINIKRDSLLIEDNGALQSNPSIKDGKVYWDDYRSNESGKYQIYYYDIPGQARTSYSLGATGARAPKNVSASKDYIVFATTPLTNTGQDIYAYKISENKAFKINIVNPKNDQILPAVSENGIVVWADLRNGNSDLYSLDLNNPEASEKELLVMVGGQSNPRISGDNVVWTDTRTGNRTDIYYKNMNGGNEVLVAQNTLGISPDIWQNYIVWASRNVLSLYDINTAKTIIIPTTGTVTQARINEGKIVAINNGSILVYDIASQKGQVVEVPNLTFSHPYYGEGYITFQGKPSDSTINDNIYLISY